MDDTEKQRESNKEKEKREAENRIIANIKSGRTPITETEPGILKFYNAYKTNYSLSWHHELIMVANIMNLCPKLPDRIQFDFLHSVVRKRKWPFINRPGKIPGADAKTRAVMKYYGYSRQKAEEAMEILTPDQVKHIQKVMTVGRFEKP